MAGFLYYLPRFQGTPKAQQMLPRGLGYAFDSQSLVNRGCDRGPDKGAGMIVAHSSFDASHLGYYPERQQWRKLIGSEDWVGMYTDERRPTPKCLARDQQISGQWLTLEDGQQWLFPIARRWFESGDELRWDYNLPSALDVDDSGNWIVGGPVAKYAHLWKMAMDWEAAVQRVHAGEEFVSFPIFDMTLECLKTNYRLGMIELVMLGIATTELGKAAANILTDAKTADALLKKKERSLIEGGSSS